MRKYNITYSCRHKGRVDLFEKTVDRKKKAVLIVLCFMIALMFCSCNFINPFLRNDTNKKGTYVLCDRQKKILKQEGLPLDYEKLNDTQKSAIECIEDIFKYLDKTYPKEKFEYSGYVPYSTLEPEHLIVESQYGEVTVNRYVSTDSPNDPPTFKDDFKDVKAADIYATVVDDYLAKKYDIDDYCVIAYVSNYFGKNYDIKRITKECYNTNVSVYVNGKVGLKTFKMITTDLIDYMKENTGKNIVSADIYFINSSDFSMDLPEEFNNGLSRDVIKKHISYYRYDDGEEKIFGDEDE